MKDEKKREEIFRIILEKSIQTFIESTLKSNDFCERYYKREIDDQKEIEKIVKELTPQISEIIVKKIADKGFDKALDQKEFNKIIADAWKEYEASINGRKNDKGK